MIKIMPGMFHNSYAKLMYCQRSYYIVHYRLQAMFGHVSLQTTRQMVLVTGSLRPVREHVRVRYLSASPLPHDTCIRAVQQYTKNQSPGKNSRTKATVYSPGNILYFIRRPTTLLKL